MPLAQLEELVFSKLAGLEAKVKGDPRPVPGAVMDQMASPVGAMPGPMAMDVSPALIQAATSALVQAGLLAQPASEMTPEVMQAIQTLVDKTSPGLYNLNDPADLSEVLGGIANGTLLGVGIGSG